MSIAKWRRAFYLTSRTLGDVQAVKRGRVGQRITNRIVGRAMSKAMKGVWR